VLVILGQITLHCQGLSLFDFWQHLVMANSDTLLLGRRIPPDLMTRKYQLLLRLKSEVPLMSRTQLHIEPSSNSSLLCMQTSSSRSCDSNANFSVESSGLVRDVFASASATSTLTVQHKNAVDVYENNIVSKDSGVMQVCEQLKSCIENFDI